MRGSLICIVLLALLVCSSSFGGENSDGDQELAKVWWASSTVQQLSLQGGMSEWIGHPLMLCPVARGVPADIAGLGTLLMYESTGWDRPELRQKHWNPAFKREDFAHLAELVLGRPANDAEAETVSALYDEYARKAHFGGKASTVGGSPLASLTLAVHKHALEGQRDPAKALSNLQERMGWAIDLEEMEAPVDSEILRRAFRKNVPFLYRNQENREWYLGIGMGTRETGEEFVVMGKVSQFALGKVSRWDAEGSDAARRDYPPGCDRWRAKNMASEQFIPFDARIVPGGELPAAFGAFDLPLERGRVMWVHGLRPDEDSLTRRIAEGLGIPTARADAADGNGDPESSSLWRDHVMATGRSRIGGDWDLVAGLPLIPANEGREARSSALISALLATHPEPDGLLSFAFSEKDFVAAARDARWQGLAPAVQEKLRQYYSSSEAPNDGARQRRHALVENNVSMYDSGYCFWGLSESETSGLQALFREIGSRHQQRTTPDATNDAFPQYLTSLFRGERGWEGMLQVLGKSSGWGATMESVEAPSFAMLKRAIELGLPALLEDPDGSCRLLGGFLRVEGREYLLTIDPTLVEPWLATEGTSAEEHLQRLLLPAAAPGRIQYLEKAANERFAVHALLDPRLPLPPGARLEKFEPGSYRATFVCSWRKSVGAYASECQKILAPEPPETQAPVSFRMRLPRPSPEVITEPLQIVEIRSSKMALYVTDRVLLGAEKRPGGGTTQRDRDCQLYAAEGLIEMSLLPGSYWIWIQSLPVATLSVASEDNDRVVDAKWLDLPSPRDARIALPASLPGSHAYGLMLTPYLSVTQRAILGYTGLVRIPEKATRRGAPPEDQILSARLLPGLFYVYRGDRCSFRDPPIGKIVVPAEPTDEALPIVPVTPAEAEAATGDIWRSR